MKTFKFYGTFAIIYLIRRSSSEGSFYSLVMPIKLSKCQVGEDFGGF